MSKCSIIKIPHRAVKKERMTCVMGELITIIISFTWTDLYHVSGSGYITLNLSEKYDFTSILCFIRGAWYNSPSGKHYFTFSFIYAWSSRCVVDSMCFLRYCVVFYFFQVKTMCSSSYTHVWLSVTLFSNFLYREYEVAITLFAYIRCPHHAYSTPLMSFVV